MTDVTISGGSRDHFGAETAGPAAPRQAIRAPRRSALILNGAVLAETKGELGASGFEVVLRGIDELAFTIGAGTVGVHETVSGRDLADFSFVHVASFPKPTGTLLNAVTAYLRHHGVDAVNAEGIGAPTRLLQYVRFAQAGIPVPVTRYVPPRILAGVYPELAEQLGLPFVLTPLRGGAGRRDLLISDEASFAGALCAADHANFMAREFIPADAVHHLLVLGREVSMIMRQDISFAEPCLPRISEGGTLSLIDAAGFNADARNLGVQAASLMGLDVAGVSIVRHWTTSEWCVLDTNASLPFSAGAFVSHKVNAYTGYLWRKLV